MVDLGEVVSPRATCFRNWNFSSYAPPDNCKPLFTVLLFLTIVLLSTTLLLP